MGNGDERERGVGGGGATREGQRERGSERGAAREGERERGAVKDIQVYL